MPRAKECERCQLFTGGSGATDRVCRIYPAGPTAKPCPDHAPIAEDCSEIGGAYYDGQRIRDTGYMSSADRLHLLSTHPLFTGVCPECGSEYPETIKCQPLSEKTTTNLASDSKEIEIYREEK
jgi:hypothetical protein